MKDYKKILEGVMNIIYTAETSDIGLANICDYISENCPELKESEEERSKKWILEYLYDGLRKSNEQFKDDFKTAIAWLEKQGGQRETLPIWKYKNDSTPLSRDSLILNKYGCVAKSPSGAIIRDAWVLDYGELAKLPKEKIEKQSDEKSADNVEPKFKVGDWIIINGFVLKITEIQNDLYETIYQHDELRVYDTSVIDNEAHLWTIQDAKDGDVLISRYNDPFIYKGYSDTLIDSYGGIISGDQFHVACEQCSWTLNENIHPATKEQRDLLFLKMIESGYEWDAENKKLNKIEPKFKVGDWISNYMRDVHIASIENGTYYFDEGDGLSIVFVDEHYHLWTIEEAMSGDVLVCDGKYGQEIGIVKKYIGKYGGCDMCFDTYCYVDWDGIFRVGEYIGGRHIYPATKEQRDLLFHKMKEAGYEFDFKKEELKKFK